MQDMKEDVRSFVKESEGDTPTSLVILISSHGGAEGKIYGSDGNTVKDVDLIEMVHGGNVPKNLNKFPKLLLFQTCRGGIIILYS